MTDAGNRALVNGVPECSTAQEGNPGRDKSSRARPDDGFGKRRAVLPALDAWLDLTRRKLANHVPVARLRRQERRVSGPSADAGGPDCPLAFRPA
ncbi:MAG: hypothetical protein HLUCCO07_11305 [Rhodobacteraceae bacterium HLUCCO07]|nr:MAG: hypothetical protein HLUCCO07_11305 [Rhodobacteraceae bacterium HLUCCO07]